MLKLKYLFAMTIVRDDDDNGVIVGSKQFTPGLWEFFLENIYSILTLNESKLETIMNFPYHTSELKCIPRNEVRHCHLDI